jgi:Ca2+-binding EF-hand superfamily protein
MFAHLDGDSDGHVSFGELDALISLLNGDRRCKQQELATGVEHPALDSKGLWAALDRNRSGRVSLNEFAEGARAASKADKDRDDGKEGQGPDSHDPVK